MACDSVKFASCVLALPTCESCVADAYAGSAPSGKSPILSGDLCTRRASGTPVEISPSPAKNAPSRQPQVWTLKASIGVMMVPPIPIELLMRVIASALRRINQLFARASGERQRNHAQVNCEESVIGIDSGQ